MRTHSTTSRALRRWLAAILTLAFVGTALAPHASAENKPITKDSKPCVSGSACDDGNNCTYNDVCTNALCQGTTVTCTSTACATSICNGTSTCSVTNAPDGTACGVPAGVCRSGLCLVAGAKPR